MESDQAKLFVGGITRDTNEETLVTHFSEYGTVLGSAIARERHSRNPRGFGFVWFSDTSSADEALKANHVILGRTVEVKKAIPRSEQHHNQPQPEQQQQQQQQFQDEPDEPKSSRLSKHNTSYGSSIDCQFRTQKIFVGGLSASLTEQEFKNYFEKFGKILDVVVMHDNMTNRPRGFGFVTFDSEESVENVMQKSFHELAGRLVEVKRAVPKEEIIGSTLGYNNARVFAGKGTPYNTSQPGNYPPYSPGYGFLPGYVPVPGYSGVGGYISGAGVFGGGYPMIAYGKFGYGVTPIVPRSPWYAPVMMGAGQCPYPYDSASFFPAYMNGGVGVTGMMADGYNGIVDAGVEGKLSQHPDDNGLVLADATASQIEGMKLGDSTGLKESNDGAPGERNQEGVDERFKPLLVGTSR